MVSRIQLYFHCKDCLLHNRKQQLAAGWTKEGLQVICELCDKNVVDLDFMGQKIDYYQEKK